MYVPTTGAQTEPYNSGWEFYFDNDAFALPNVYSDQDYTGGVAISLLGRRAAEYPISLDGVRAGLDRALGHSKLYSYPSLIEQHSIEFGVASFTPKNIASVGPVYDDRPYSSLVFLANSYKATIPERQISYHSSFVVGVLGLRVTDNLQQAIHGILGIETAKGWANQISEGGELTARYSFSRQKIRAFKASDQGMGYQVNSMVSGSIGYITDVGVGVFARGGKFYSPWWSFNPHQTESIPIGAPIASSRKNSDGTERYLWGGMNLRYRFYNALLQGQFRDSAVTFSPDQINSLVLESWVGYTRSFGKNYRANFTVRANTPDLKIGEQRAPVWVSVVVSKSI